MVGRRSGGPGDHDPAHPIVSPVGGHRHWAELAHDDPELAGWCMARWLGPYKRLEPWPSPLASTRAGMHRLAAWVITPARKAATGKIGLRWTYGGFGTPFFGDDEQVRVDGGALVHQRAGGCEAAPLTTLADAAAFVGRSLDPAYDHGFADVPALGDPDAPLDLDERAAFALGDWLGFTWSVLEEVRAEVGATSRVQLWPEHFDAAFDAVGANGGRANLGCSPGDTGEPEPYCYVGPWEPQHGEFWSASFGAILSSADVIAASDQRGAALDFFRAGLALL